MKKAITILAMIAIVAAAVFADPAPASEKHTLTVKTVVAEVIPSFQLKYVSNNAVYTNATADSNNINTQTYGGQFADQGAYGDQNTAGVIDLNQDISRADVTATFRAVLAIGGKQKDKIYTLAFEAGAFNTTHNGGDDSTACSQTSLNNVVNNTKPTVVISAATTGNQLSNGNSKSTTITMKGAAAEEKIDLVEFVAKWPRNEDADMGEYTADVTLTITAGN